MSNKLVLFNPKRNNMINGVTQGPDHPRRPGGRPGGGSGRLPPGGPPPHRGKKPLPAITHTPRKPAGKVKATSSTQIPKFLGANLAPHSEGAFGVKVPDESTMPTITAFGRTETAVGSDGNGTSVAVFRAHPAACQVNPNTTAASSWTFNAAFGNSVGVDNITPLKNTFSLIRTCAYGIKITCPDAATSAKGYVHISVCPDKMDGTTWAYPLNITQMEFAPSYARYPISELVGQTLFVSGRYSDATAFRYVDPNNTDAAAGTYLAGFPAAGWGAILVVTTGALASESPITIEYIAHYEGMVGETSANFGVNTPTYSPSSPVEMAASSYVLDNVQPSNLNTDWGRLFGDIGDVWNRGVQAVTGIVSGIVPILKFFI